MTGNSGEYSSRAAQASAFVSRLSCGIAPPRIGVLPERSDLAGVIGSRLTTSVT
jgi:hypothetical protein